MNRFQFLNGVEILSEDRVTTHRLHASGANTTEDLQEGTRIAYLDHPVASLEVSKATARPVPALELTVKACSARSTRSTPFSLFMSAKSYSLHFDKKRQRDDKAKLR